MILYDYRMSIILCLLILINYNVLIKYKFVYISRNFLYLAIKQNWEKRLRVDILNERKIFNKGNIKLANENRKLVKKNLNLKWNWNGPKITRKKSRVNHATEPKEIFFSKSDPSQEKNYFPKSNSLSVKINSITSNLDI